MDNEMEDSGNTEGQSQETEFQCFLKNVREFAWLKNEKVFCNLRVPDKSFLIKDDINVVILTAKGILCIDVKHWKGSVSKFNENWQVKEDDQKMVYLVEDPLRALKTKMDNLYHHFERNGVSLQRHYLYPRVVFLSPACQLDEKLMIMEELVCNSQIEDFLCTLREGFMDWMLKTLAPSWISRCISNDEITKMHKVLCGVGTWDVLRLCYGIRLKGDYKSSQYITFDRNEIGTLEFSKENSLWALFGHEPQVIVKMYRRTNSSGLGKPLVATTNIPPQTHIIFRKSGEEENVKIPASAIDCINLSI